MPRVTIALGVIPVVLGAQQPPSMPIRPIGAVTGTSAVTFQQVQHLRALSDGRVLVNDPGRRQVVLLDSALANATVVIDSAGGVNMYGLSAAALIPFAGDSTLFVDRGASAFLVIDPKGEVTRVMSFPSGNPATYLVNPASYGYPGYSSTFGVAYRVSRPRPQMQRPRQGEPEITRQYEDSAAILTMEIKRRTIDTLTRIGTGATVTIRLSSNGTNSNTKTPLFPVLDDWTVMADGSVAVLRGREYRIDFYDGDGRTAGPRLFYPWKQLDDAEKTRVADSINTHRRKQYDEMLDDMRKRAENPNQPIGPGGEKIIIVDGMPIRTFNGERMPPPKPPEPVVMTDVPDYLPAYERGSANFRADADNRLWIRPKPAAGTPRGGGAVYEVVDRTGRLVDRVQLPAGRTLAGFGPGGVVYLLARDGNTTKLERRSFK